MSEFFFATWPNGVGPNLLQIGLTLLGAVAGIRAIDDVKALLAAREGRRAG